MVDLPFIIPKDISNEGSIYDCGFLRRALPEFEPADPIHDLGGIVDVFKEFALEHSACMLYRADTHGEKYDRVWFPCNYAYRDIKVDESKLCFSGKAYGVTGFDGSVVDGSERSFLNLNRDLGATLIPYRSWHDDGIKLKAFVLGMEYERGGLHRVNLLVGNNLSSKLEMPRFKAEPIMM